MPGKRTSPRGFILPLALLIMASVVAITTSLVRGLFSGISVARGTSAAVTAYFAAETGVEKGLYTVKTLRLTAGTVASAIISLNAASSDGTMARPGASFNVSGDNNEILNLGLKQNQVATIDLFDPDNLGITSSGISCLSLNAGDANPSPVNAVTPWLEVTFVQLTPVAGNIGFDPANAVDTRLEADRADVNSRLALGTGTWPKLMNVNSGKNYRVRLKALYDDVAQLTVIPLQLGCGAATNPTVPFKSRIVIKSVGAYPAGTTTGARQALTASANWLTPSSPLFDYTLFSEEAIEKR